MVPFIGTAHVAYLPRNKVVGISKIARLVDIFSKRLQTQETMTSQIANTLNNALKPRGVAVLIDANHQCMSTRGVHKVNSSTITTSFLGEFKIDQNLEKRFWNIIKIQSKEC
jgi:GTP cyclohydrolase I